MIVEAFLSLLAALVEGVINLLPSFSTPAWLTGIGPKVSEALSYASGMGAWIPWTLAGQVFSFVLVCVGIGFLIKITRIVASFLSAGGGGAG